MCDRVLRLHELVEATWEDLLGNALDAYLWSVLPRANEIRTRLTLLRAIFLPLALLPTSWARILNTCPLATTGC